LKFSLTMFGYPIAHYAPTARAAEAAGFECIWLAEHLVVPTGYAKVYPYNTSGDPGYTAETPLADVWVTIGNVSAVTTTIKLGTGVFVLPLRNPFATAKAIATAQELSGGRVWLGVGTGWMQEEFDAVGERWEGRGSRTDEIIEILHKLWTGRPVAHTGKWYAFDEVQMSPRLDTPPPIVIGGVSKPALNRAARLGDAWYGPSCSLDESAGYRDEILRRLAAVGREPAGFRFYCRLNDQIGPESLSHARQLGLEHLVVSLPYTLVELEQKLERITELGMQIGEANVDSDLP
jgi:probable F420-dependent oxidoreductase